MGPLGWFFRSTHAPCCRGAQHYLSTKRPGKEMKSPMPRLLRPLIATALMFLTSSLASAADSAASVPAGIVEFAGRVARNHSYLFPQEKRSDLERLNRELREAQRQFDRAPGEQAKQAAADRGTAAAGRFLEIVKTCPQLIRVDL